MPLRNASKRTLEEIIAHEDSEDEDYDDKVQGSSSKSRPGRSRGVGRPAKKVRRKGGYRGSDVDSDDEDVIEDDSQLSGGSSEEEIETNEKGRPVRRTAKRVVKYEESDPSDDNLHDLSSEGEDSEPLFTPKKSLIVKLKTSTPIAMGRILRNRSDSHVTKPPSSSAPAGTRRSSRLSHGEEDLLALTNSGRHVEIARPGSREPDLRPTRGGKGMKHPSKSTIDEENEGSPVKYDDGHEDDDMEIAPSQQEVLDSVPASQVEIDDISHLESNLPLVLREEVHDEGHETADPLQESEPDRTRHIDDDDEEGPIHRGRLTRGSNKRKAESPPVEDGVGAVRKRLRARGRSQRVSGKPSKPNDESSDFDPDNEGANDDQMSSSEGSQASPRKSQRDDYESSNGGRRSTRLRRQAASAQRTPDSDEEDELLAEVEELKKDSKRKRPANEEILFEPRGARRGGKKPNYNLLRNLAPIEDEEEVVAAPSPSARARKPGGGSWQRSFFNVYGPFGGGGGQAPVLGGPPRAQGDVDSDSSDDEVMKLPKPVGGMTGMTPTQPTPGGFNPFAVQPLNTDPIQAAAGTPANLGKIKDKQALADADPLGVDQNVSFDNVGGLQGHIDQLKEMVSLPLLYPEIFMRFKITPPRGVLFHGPPGTGKTLLARALANSVSSEGRKVTFYMRKGADALSKWVGEAERQLRLLFEEARKTQPSIIFFDEIDGLAPVRSSKQEQIHASIVSTLLALMDGMDGRGQVIVIGATNRPDSIDPALRRPGRFDREFYFPLPNTEARRAILDIHTRGWNPELAPAIKDELAELTKGYGGADLRALCTEAALNAVQRRYPQIYKAREKLLIDPKTIEVTPKDFMISVKKMVPSSERSVSSGASPLPSNIAPLLKRQLAEIERVITEVLPQRKKLSALEEAQYEDIADGYGFGRERMQQSFETSRVFRPRLLIHGKIGMGQQYVAAALLNHFEGLHVQNFDLQTLLSDSTSSPEATVIRLFSEVKMHKPSVIYISNVLEWYRTVTPSVISTFFSLLRSIKPTDPILVLGVLEEEDDQEELERGFRRDLFGYSKRNQYRLMAPSGSERREFFEPLKNYVRTSPSDFPDPVNRKKRQLEILRIAPPEPERPPPEPSKEELKAQKRRDRQTLNLLKIRLQPIMDQIRTRHKKFRTGVIDESQIRYLLDEADPGTVTSDIPTEMLATASFRPFEVGRDAHGVTGFVDQANGKFYYNLDSVTIEKRLSNGYYKRPKDFLADIRRLAKDAKTIGDEDRLLKANELLANVEVDIGGIELGEPVMTAECEKVYQRELLREKMALAKARAANDSQDMPPPQAIMNVPHNQSSGPSATTVSDGPIILGEPVVSAKDLLGRRAPVTPSRPLTHSSNLTNGVRTGDAPNTNGSGAYNSTDSGNQADAEGESHAEGQDSHPSSNQRSNETQKTNTTSSFGNRESAQPRPYHSYTAPSQQLRRDTGMSEPLSQVEFVTPMQPGSTAADYANEASTTQTTSGKKNSSGEREQYNTQDSGPNLYLLGERRSADGSEIPDTQSDQASNIGNAGLSQPSNANPNSQQALARIQQSSQPNPPTFESGAASQPRPQTQPYSPPQSRITNGGAVGSSVTGGGGGGGGGVLGTASTGNQIVDLLNPEPQSNLIQADEHSLDRMIGEIADRTSGMSVEQLEQVNSVLMDTLWKTRGEWNRRRVLDNIIDAFNNVTEDMTNVGQEFGSSSWGRITQD